MLPVHRAIAMVALFTMAACASTAPTARHTPVAPAVGSPRSTASPKVHARKAPPKPKVIISRFRAADGTVVTLARFRGAVHYRLHSGSADPGPVALAVVRAGPSIGGSERRRLLAAFNGGFLLSAGAGGYEQEGHVISLLRRGLASLVIDRSGTASSWTLPGHRGAVFEPQSPARPARPTSTSLGGPATSSRFSPRDERGAGAVGLGRTSHHANRPILIEGDPLPVHLRRSRARKAAR